MTAFVTVLAGARHASCPSSLLTLCGRELAQPSTAPWPGSGGALCRDCARLAAGSQLPFTVRRRRPGGMG